MHRLLQVLLRLRDAGNTLIVIEHNLDVIKTADYIVDLGPEGGDEGGRVVACGTPEEIAANPASHTGDVSAADSGGPGSGEDRAKRRKPDGEKEGMKKRWIIWMFVAWAAVAAAPGFAQEAEEEESVSTGKLTVEEAGRLLATGRAAYEDGLYRLARRRLEELVAGAPDKRRQAEGALWLARVLRAEKKPEAALAMLEAYEGQVRAAALAAEYAWCARRPVSTWGRPPKRRDELDDLQGEGMPIHASAPGRLASAGAGEGRARRMGGGPGSLRPDRVPASGESRGAGRLAGRGLGDGRGGPVGGSAHGAGACRDELCAVRSGANARR